MRFYDVTSWSYVNLDDPLYYPWVNFPWEDWRSSLWFHSSFTLVISYWSCNSTHVTEYCAVIGPAFHSARQQTAAKEVTRPLPSLAERGGHARLGDSLLLEVLVRCPYYKYVLYGGKICVYAFNRHNCWKNATPWVETTIWWIWIWFLHQWVHIAMKDVYVLYIACMCILLSCIGFVKN